MRLKFQSTNRPVSRTKQNSMSSRSSQSKSSSQSLSQYTLNSTKFLDVKMLSSSADICIEASTSESYSQGSRQVNVELFGNRVSSLYHLFDILYTQNDQYIIIHFQEYSISRQFLFLGNKFVFQQHSKNDNLRHSNCRLHE